MAYIALYRKWRPKLFEDVVGQRHITETLQQAIKNDKVAHAYLFSGPRGTGKTSTAKIFAKAVNCVHGPTLRPCNECPVCRHITSGESLDVVEIDAASNRSIEDIRQLRETVKFMPTEGDKKIYIIDEVHMLTTEAFNALLKTLEEPPSHVIFILATTEPERIPMTILSRCQRYEFRRITSHDIGERLMYIASQEHIALTEGAAHIIAVQADGGMRDALSLLDQCIGNGGGTVDEVLVRQLLGLVGKDWLFTMTTALFHRHNDILIKGVDEIIAMGKEPQVLLTEIIAHLRAVMLYKAAPGSDTLAAYADSEKELQEQAATVSAGQVFAVLNILQEALLRVKTSPLPRIAVEAGLLMAARTYSHEGEDLTERVKALEERAYTVPQDIMDRIVQLEQGQSPVSAAAMQVRSASGCSTRSEIPAPVIPAAQSTIAESVTEPPEAEAVTTIATAVSPEAADMREVQTVKKRRTRPEKAEYAIIWNKVCTVLDKDRKKAVLSCVRNGRVAYIGETEFILALKTEFMVTRANREDYYACVDAALAQVLGKGYHMHSYLEGDAELAEYEKKNDILPAMMIRPVSPDPLGVPAETVLESQADGSKDPVLIERQDIPEAERTVLDSLLSVVGDCNIYVEYKD